MRVERSPSGGSGGRLRKTWGNYPLVGDTQGNPWLIPHEVGGGSSRRGKPKGAGEWARGLSGSWRGNGPPSLRRVAGLRGWPARGALRHGPHSYGRQQRGILGNGRKPDPATPRGGRRP